MESLFSQKGNKTLYFDGFHYYKNRQTPTATYWKCQNYKLGCSGRVIEKCKKYTQSKEHNHPGEPEKVEIKKSLHEIREKSKRSMQTPQSIIATALDSCSVKTLANLPSVSSMKRTVRHIREKENNFPALPLRLEDIKIPDEFQVTAKGTTFLLFDSGPEPERFLIFGSRECLNVLSNSTIWYMDGTFHVTPPLFAQLFSIHGQIGQIVIPCIYMLLANKTEKNYKIVLQKVSELVIQKNVKTIITDFELALENSLKAIFPNVLHKGCYFHFAQCLYRNIQNKGLKRLYDTDIDFSNSIKLFKALAFIPVQLVDRAFCLLCNRDNLVPEEARTFIEYFQNTWVGRRNISSPVYPPTLWNCFDSIQSNLPITNNHIEGWHSSLKKQFDAKQPSLWQFIKSLQKEEAMTEIKIIKEQTQDGNTYKKKYKDIKQRIGRIVLSCDFNEMDDEQLVELLQRISYFI